MMDNTRFIFNDMDVTGYILSASFRIAPGSVRDLAIAARYIVPCVMVYSGSPIVNVTFRLPPLEGFGNVVFDAFHGAVLKLQRNATGAFEYLLNDTALKVVEGDIQEFAVDRHVSEITMEVSKELDMRQFVPPAPEPSTWKRNLESKANLPTLAGSEKYPATNAEGRPLIPVVVPHRVRQILHSIGQQLQEAHELGWFVGVGYEADQPPAMRHNHILIQSQPHFQQHYSKEPIKPKAVEIRIETKTGPFYE